MLTYEQFVALCRLVLDGYVANEEYKDGRDPYLPIIFPSGNVGYVDIIDYFNIHNKEYENLEIYKGEWRIKDSAGHIIKQKKYPFTEEDWEAQWGEDYDTVTPKFFDLVMPDLKFWFDRLYEDYLKR